MTRIIGIDPGLNRTGWGVIEAVANRLSFVAAGTITSNVDEALPERLLALHGQLALALAEWRLMSTAIG